LKAIGLHDPAALVPDKISAAANRFCQDEKSVFLQKVCRLIEQRVLSTPWNLSSSFIQAKTSKVMLLLEGIGDPSHGHGGVSYLKMPMKVSADQNDGLASLKDQRA
jgi:hypothetical protein